MAYPGSDVNGAVYVDPTTGKSYTYNAALGFWAPTPAVASGGYVHEVVPITTFGQAIFVLAGIPSSTPPTALNVNGVDYFQPDFTLAGNVVTWAGPITLETTDKLVVSYTPV